MTPQIYALGESALVLALDPPATIEVQRRIWSVAAAARQWLGVAEAVVGMNNVTLILESPFQPQQFLPTLQRAWESAGGSSFVGRRIEIPVRYGGENGPDLAYVARQCGCSERDVIQMHSEREYVVYFIGFQPGFPYLGGLDSRLQVPRRVEPRQVVPAGSVAIAGEQTGIYPLRSPGGWHLIGKTDLQLFDPMRTPPSLLAPGDRVVFLPLVVA